MLVHPVVIPGSGDRFVDRSRGRRRAGRPGRPVSGLSHRHRQVAEHGEGVRSRTRGLLVVLHRVPRPGLARGPAGGPQRVRGWLQLPPAGRAGEVAVLPSVTAQVTASTVNRKLSVSAFYAHQARNGAGVGDLLAAWWTGGAGGSHSCTM